MLADFAINNTGDLLFQEQDINSTSLKVSFALSKTKATKIVFDFSEFELNTPSNNVSTWSNLFSGFSPFFDFHVIYLVKSAVIVPTCAFTPSHITLKAL